MKRQTRAGWIAHYLHYLHARDGEPDLKRKILPNRERLYAEADAKAPPTRPLVDQAVFDQNLRQRRSAGDLNGRTRWALAVARTNRAENYGITYKLQRRGHEQGGARDPLTFVELQELYHSRIFLGLLASIGVQTDLLPPNGITRLLVRLIVLLPRSISDIIVLNAELAGVAAFRLLRDEARQLFADQPELIDRINFLFGQILVDEVSHVLYVRSRLGPARLWLAQRLLPWIALGMVDNIEDVVALVGKQRYLDAVLATDLRGAVADQPDLLPLLSAP